MQDQSKPRVPEATPDPQPISPTPLVLTPAELAKVSGAGLARPQSPHGSW